MKSSTCILFRFAITICISNVRTESEWVQLPSLEPPPSASTSSPQQQATSDDESSSTNSSDTKPGVAEHFIGEMQLAHQRLRASLWPHKEEPRTLKDKLHYLSALRNHILNNIARTMFGLNSEDGGRSLRRQKRGGGWGSGDNTEIGFPSLEVALLTLAFLVFAVFLVNMVLVLFSNIFGSTTTTGTTGQALGRRRRDAIEEERNEDTVQVLQAIEEFPLRHRQMPAHCYVDSETRCETGEAPHLPQIARFLKDLKI